MMERMIIILPSSKPSTQEIEFFTAHELQLLSTVQLSTETEDNEDYSKW